MLSVFLLVYIRAQKRELRMKMPEIKVTYILFILACILSCHLHMHSVSCQCLHDQKSLLLELRNSLEFDHSYSTKLVTWNESTDCCRWVGVSCNLSNGQVIGLNLTDEGITGGLHNSSSLFQLQSLQSLSLASNYFDGRIPSAMGKLSDLNYLNMSSAGFTGQVPIEISHLAKLFILYISDISDWYDGHSQLRCPNLATVVRNMTELRELHLDGVDISAAGKELWEPLLSSVPHLQVLSMSSCGLSGEIPESLANLYSLSAIDLSRNNLSGTFPGKVLQMPALRSLDLSVNEMLQGTLPDFLPNASLETLALSRTKFSGSLPKSIGNLKRLKELDLSSCNFDGVIPSSITSLNQLESLDLSENKFSGPIPNFSSMKNIQSIDLDSNQLSGSIVSTNWGMLLNLESLDLSDNSLTGSIPASLFLAPSLGQIDLAQNKFSGRWEEFETSPSSNLEWLWLGSNDLEGPIPNSISQLRGLKGLSLDGNRFNGTLKLNEFLHQFTNLTDLSLSDNCLSIDASGTPPTTDSSFPQLWALGLGSCNLGVLPRQFLTTQLQLWDLDLSNNHMEGAVPTWIWNLSVGSLYSLNLSYNNFEHLEQPIPYAPELLYLDLHSNNIQGELPSLIFGTGLRYLDCSSNNFTSVTPDIGNHLTRAFFLSLARNHIYGTIPISLCNATWLEVLDLEHNRFKGTIPHCLVAMTNQSSLAVLNARENNLSGEIPDIFGTGCSLETADFNGNFLQRRVPKSLANCTELKVLDLGNNRLNDTFPCELKSLLDLRVLILRSNNFCGSVSCPKNTSVLWPSLQILDLASNQFNGGIPSQFILQWKSMTAGEYQNETQPDMLQYMMDVTGTYYQDSVTITFKDNDYELQKTLSIYSSIDLSDNAFQGNIPQDLGILNGLKALNLSHNSLSGHIPSSFGNLTNLESLDLSRNGLTGKIPRELANLNFLEVLNLSFNKLEGLIPTGTQLQSFDASSYKGNKGLYGPPLTPYSASEHAPEFTRPTSGYESDWNSKSEVEWMLRGAEVGFPVGLTIFVGPLLYIKRWRLWYCKHLERLVMKILQREDQARGRRNKNRRQQQQQKRSRGN